MDPQPLSRRALLRAAGGLSFLALVPDERGFAAHGAFGEAPPLFTALPYLQPGPDGGPLVDGQESVLVVWQTDDRPAAFSVTVDHGQAHTPVRAERWSGDDGEKRFNYAARIDGLPLNTRCRYRVTMNGTRLADGWFTTRKPRGTKTRFVAFGDNSYGDISDRMIAYQAFKARPDFVMNTGDNVYEDGTDNEYARYFFPVYNADGAAPRTGAPLLRSVPFYTVLGNHDIHGKDKNGGPVADFEKFIDSLAYYTNLHLPLNGLTPAAASPMIGPEAAIAHFRACAGARYPRMANYAFDYGDAHFLCLDSNLYVDPTDPGLHAWIESDLRATDAAWKIVVFHHPGFNVGKEHYQHQHMRVLSPLFERRGVHLVLHGHEHNYQRTRPLRFAPRDVTAARNVGSKMRWVPGTFTIDRTYDGGKNTRPDGVIYLTTGAGGKSLYDPGQNDDPRSWRHPEDNDADYIARFVSDRHSLTVIDMDARHLEIHQIDAWGQEIDRFQIRR
jgi:hypothetical protein